MECSEYNERPTVSRVCDRIQEHPGGKCRKANEYGSLVTEHKLVYTQKNNSNNIIQDGPPRDITPCKLVRLLQIYTASHGWGIFCVLGPDCNVLQSWYSFT